MKIYLPLIAIVMPLPALSIVDVNFTGSSLQWVGPYNNHPERGEKPPLINGCYGNEGYHIDYYCLTPGVRTYTPDVSFVSPDDPISLMPEDRAQSIWICELRTQILAETIPLWFLWEGGIIAVQLVDIPLNRFIKNPPTVFVISPR
ncbi:hypothetical protein ABRP32_02575 [Providencia manganoxydans]|uniref:hypothetical protein n=1 Tax=Providencia manganoxydans TaxID=2923283 RepID=UPI003AF3873C